MQKIVIVRKQKNFSNEISYKITTGTDRLTDNHPNKKKSAFKSNYLFTHF